MEFEEHGGGCCGISHIFEFDTREGGEEEFRSLIADYSRNGQHLLEVVLNDNQMRNYNWAPVLLELGFRLVSRFRNANSGNMVNVFHLCNDDRSDMPFKWRKRR